jgi:hypothetical protein
LFRQEQGAITHLGKESGRMMVALQLVDARRHDAPAKDVCHDVQVKEGPQHVPLQVRDTPAVDLVGRVATQSSVFLLVRGRLLARCFCMSCSCRTRYAVASLAIACPAPPVRESPVAETQVAALGRRQHAQQAPLLVFAQLVPWHRFGPRRRCSASWGRPLPPQGLHFYLQHPKTAVSASALSLRFSSRSSSRTRRRLSALTRGSRGSNTADALSFRASRHCRGCSSVGPSRRSQAPSSVRQPGGLQHGCQLLLRTPVFRARYPRLGLLVVAHDRDCTCRLRPERQYRLRHANFLDRALAEISAEPQERRCRQRWGFRREPRR